MYSKRLDNKLKKLIPAYIKKYNLINESPYSNSYYDSYDIDWNHKPERSLRLSDHWNFVSNSSVHCTLAETEEYTQEWLLCQYRNGKYHIIERLFTKDEMAMENRMKAKAVEKEKKERLRLAKKREKEEAEFNKRRNQYEAKKKKLLDKGGNFKVRYTASVKKGHFYKKEEREEVCYCKGKWAYTSHGKKRVFELVLER